MKGHDARGFRVLGWPIVAIAGWLAAAFAATRALKPADPSNHTASFRFAVELPDSVGVANGLGIKLGLSRDGAKLAIVGMKAGRRAIYLRTSTDVDARLIPGTDSGFSPSFSPDGEWVLFHTSNYQLWKLRLAGGVPELIADSAVASSWGDDGSIVYHKGLGLWQIPGAGGQARLIATPDASRNHRRYSFPEVLPGSKHALITVWRGSTNIDSARLAAISLDNGRVTDLGVPGANPHYAAPGYIVFARAGGAVAAVPFSISKLATTGPVAPLLENVWSGDGGGTDFAVADNGMLAFHGGDADAEQTTMIVVNADGGVRELPFGKERFREPRLSPDGRHIAVAIGPPPPAKTGDVWVYDLPTGPRRQVSAAGVNSRPEWMLDGKRVAFISQQGDSQFVVARRWDASGDAEILARGVMPAFYEISMGPAGGWSAVRTGLVPGGSGITVAPTDSFSKQRAFDTGGRGVLTPRVSPTGRLIAYVTSEAGRREVLVGSISGSGNRVNVSRDGGSEPAWSNDGRTLFFRGLTHMMSVKIADGDSLIVGQPVALFPDRFRLSAAHTGYDAFPNGREFLMLSGWGPEHDRAYVMVNWSAAMRGARTAP